MSQFYGKIITKMWSCLLPIIAVAGTTVVCLGQGRPEKASERNSTSVADAKATSEARMTLEAARKEFESQYARGEESAQSAAREFRDEADRESPNAKKLARLKQALEAAVSTSFKNQLMLQKTRLQIAELDLADLHAKYVRRESQAEAIVERRVADLMSGEDLGWSTSTKTTGPDASKATADSPNVPDKQREAAAGNPVPDFATPQELLQYLENVTSVLSSEHPSQHDAMKKLQTFLGLVDKDELNRFAGVCLRTGSMFRSASKFAEGFSALTPDGANDEIIRMGHALDALMKDARLSKPPRAAQNAYEEICASEISLFQLFMSNGAEVARPTIAAEAYSKKLRKAAGVLKDPMQFLVDFTELFIEFQSGKEDDAKQEAVERKPADWQVTVDGDKAVAVDRAATTATSRVPFATNRLEMVKVGNTWKISNMIPDEEIIELQQGMKTKTSSDSDKSDSPEKGPGGVIEKPKNRKKEPEPRNPSEP